MKIIKRSGMEDTFDIKKIEAAIRKANESVIDYEKLTEEKIQEILANVEKACENMKRSPSVEEIQDMVENQIMNQRAFNVARNYITYRYKRALVRKSNSTDEQILSLLECNNEEVKQENSNKNPTVNSVQRDYMAGEVSKDITRRFLLDGDIVEAHEQGIIHFHDADYFAQHMHNCCLVNLEDMLQNGTVISETMIDRPKSFSTACNIATQAIAQIASSQYGGQSISLAHLAPFVQISREKFRRMVRKEMEEAGIPVTEEQINLIAEKGDYSKKDAEKALTTVIDSVSETLANGEKISLVGFGTFEVRERAEKTAINPRTKEQITVAAKKVPAFKAGKALKDAVNK